MEKSFEQAEVVLKALWWKKGLRLGKVTFMQRYGELTPFFTSQTTNTQAPVVGRGVSWLC